MTGPSSNTNDEQQLLITKGQSTAAERWSESNVQAVVDLWQLSSSEDQVKFRRLATSLADVEHWKNDPYEVIRYYKEFKGDLRKTEKMFRNMIRWRLDHNIDRVLATYGEPHPLFHYDAVALLAGTDRDGDPLYLDRMGETDSWGLLKHFGMEQYVNYYIYINEYINDRNTWKSYEAHVGHRVKQFNVLIDLHGLSAGHMRPGLLPLLKNVGDITQPYYAGWAKRIILMRAPSIFYYIWKFAKHFFEPHIRDMIVMTSHSDYLEVLQQYMELEHLPDCVAPGIGKGTGMPGYFENIHLEAGPVPDPDKFEAERVKEQRKRQQQQNDPQKPKTGLDRQDTGSTAASSDVSVSGRLVLTGYWQQQQQHHDHHNDEHNTGSIITAFEASSNSLSTLG